MRVFLKVSMNERWAGNDVSTRNVFKLKTAFATFPTLWILQSLSSINKWVPECLSPQPFLAGEDEGQRGKLWNKIIFLLQYLSVQKKEILILAAAHMLVSKLQGSLDLNAYHGHQYHCKRDCWIVSSICFWFQLKHIIAWLLRIMENRVLEAPEPLCAM